jgi:hypothetical protein
MTTKDQDLETYWVNLEARIESALALTGKTMEDIQEMTSQDRYDWMWYYRISIEKFFYYLLSPEFIEEYKQSRKSLFWTMQSEYYYCERFWQAIYEYQSWNSAPIVELLTKI